MTDAPVRIFLAAPMSAFASETDYSLHREVIGRTCEIVERGGNAEVYFAGRHIVATGDFDDPKAAFHTDFYALIDCDLFVLYYPAPIRSSVLVEVGMAIGRAKPCLLLPVHRDDLVFLLRQAENASGSRDIPPIVIQEIGPQLPDPGRLAELIQQAIDALVPVAS